MRNLLECCVDSVESAIAAQEGGADRLELCANLIIGGTTPDVNLFEEVRRHTNIPIHVLLRPRFGDFCYSAHEFEILKRDVALFSRLGADGIVIGILQPDGALDSRRMKKLIALAGERNITLHRAFDMCRDPYEALEEARRLKISTILTSGQKNTSSEGKELIASLVERARGEIAIMAGSGVSSETIGELAAIPGLHTFHMSGKRLADGAMEYRKQDVSMGMPLMSEYQLWQTDPEEVRRVRQAIGE